MNNNQFMNAALAVSILIGSSEMLANNKPLKPFQIVSLQTKKTLTKFSQSKGLRIIDFWATWCQACKENLTDFESGLLNDKSLNGKFEFLAVSTDETLEEVQDFFKSGPGTKLKKAKNTVWFDHDLKLSEQLVKKGVPFLVVLDQNGKTVYSHAGRMAKKDHAKLKSLVAGK